MEAFCYEIIGGPHLMYIKSLTEKNKKDNLFFLLPNITLHFTGMENGLHRIIH